MSFIQIDEFGGCVSSQHIAYGIYAPLANRYFDRLVIRARKRYGAYLIPRRETVTTIKKHTESNRLGLYGFASDQARYDQLVTVAKLVKVYSMIWVKKFYQKVKSLP